MENRIREFVLFDLFVTGIVFDRVTKLFVKDFIGNAEVPIIGDVLKFRYAENSGVAFSYPIPERVLDVLTVFLIFWIALYFFRNYFALRTFERIGLTMLLSGAIGNAWDRLTAAHVVDFISLKYFAIFNIADIFISVGALLIVLAHFIRTNDAK